MKTIALTTAALLAVPALALTAVPAHAGDDDERERTGQCSGSGSGSGSTAWTIKAKPDDGRLEVEAEVDSNRTGQTWRWTLRHNGSLAASGRSVTRGPSGSFDVERHLGDAAGADSFRFRAVNRSSGEVCVATVSR